MTAAAAAKPESFTVRVLLALDYAIAAEEQRVRVGWSGSAGSDDLAEDR